MNIQMNKTLSVMLRLSESSLQQPRVTIQTRDRKQLIRKNTRMHTVTAPMIIQNPKRKL